MQLSCTGLHSVSASASASVSRVVLYLRSSHLALCYELGCRYSGFCSHAHYNFGHRSSKRPLGLTHIDTYSLAASSALNLIIIRLHPRLHPPGSRTSLPRFQLFLPWHLGTVDLLDPFYKYISLWCWALRVLPRSIYYIRPPTNPAYIWTSPDVEGILLLLPLSYSSRSFVYRLMLYERLVEILDISETELEGPVTIPAGIHTY